VKETMKKGETGEAIPESRRSSPSYDHRVCPEAFDAMQCGSTSNSREAAEFSSIHLPATARNW
jgi:hypothetical protein